MSRFSSSKGHGPDDELGPKTCSFSIYDRCKAEERLRNVVAQMSFRRGVSMLIGVIRH